MVARSPNYPAVDLGTALAGMQNVYTKETRNKMSRAVLARHLGYNSLNGRSLGRIGAVRAYGLVDGSGDELRVSDIAVAALKAPPGSDERLTALETAATKPPLFNELREEYPDTLPSRENIEFSLAKRGFTGRGAGRAAETYLATMQLVSSNPSEYYPATEQEEQDMQAQPAETTRVSPRPNAPPAPPKPGQAHAAFPLPEGELSISYPAGISSASAKTMASFLELLVKQVQHLATAREAQPKDGD